MEFPLKLTAAAIERMISAKKSDGLDDTYFIRASIRGGGCSGYQNDLAFDNELDAEDDIFETFSANGDSIVVAADSFSVLYMKDVTLDYVTSELQEGFKFTGGSAERRHCACGSSFSE